MNSFWFRSTFNTFQTFYTFNWWRLSLLFIRFKFFNFFNSFARFLNCSYTNFWLSSTQCFRFQTFFASRNLLFKGCCNLCTLFFFQLQSFLYYKIIRLLQFNSSAISFSLKRNIWSNKIIFHFLKLLYTNFSFLCLNYFFQRIYLLLLFYLEFV